MRGAVDSAIDRPPGRSVELKRHYKMPSPGCSESVRQSTGWLEFCARGEFAALDKLGHTPELNQTEEQPLYPCLSTLHCKQSTMIGLSACQAMSKKYPWAPRKTLGGERLRPVPFPNFKVLSWWVSRAMLNWSVH